MGSSDNVVVAGVMVPFESDFVSRCDTDARWSSSVGNITNDVSARYILNRLLATIKDL